MTNGSTCINIAVGEIGTVIQTGDIGGLDITGDEVVIQAPPAGSGN